MLRMLSILSFVTTMLLSSTAFAQTESEPLSMLDQSFLMAASQANNAEIVLSQLALQNARNNRVRQFAEMMIADHTTVGTTLDNVAAANDAAVVSGISAAGDVFLLSLSQLEGRAFDRAYMRQMVLEHQRLLQLFRAEAQYGSDADVVGFAQATLPSLRAHLRRANRLLNTLQPGSNGGNGQSNGGSGGFSAS